MTTAVQTASERARNPWWDLGRFVLLFLALMFAYEAIRDFVAPGAAATLPYRHADRVISTERSLGLFVEPDVQSIVHTVPGGRFATTWFYTLAYTAGYAVFFLWVFLRHRKHLLFLNTWYWLTNGLALLVYALYPMAPPRFVAGLGLEDTTKSALELGGGLSWFEPFRNLYAAMPSMHVGQTVLYALSVTWLLRSPWRLLVWLWPAAMLTTVMATANHYWLDGLGGTVCVAVALGITAMLVRDRPWGSQPVPVPAT